VSKVSALLRLAQFTFWAALIFTFVCAVLPSQHVIHIFKWDKAEHFLAFYVLTGLAVAAFPHGSLIIIAAALSAFGALIELVQGLSFVGRDRDFQDWVTDTIAIGMAMAPMLAVWWRAQVGREESARRDVGFTARR
jgi:Na+/H+-dicarboxylate symporter